MSRSLGRATLQWAWRTQRGQDIGTMPVQDTEIVFGGRGGHFRVEGHSVSKRLARIVRMNGGVWVEDLGGGAEVRVNGVRVERAELHNGDHIEVGSASLTIGAM